MILISAQAFPPRSGGIQTLMAGLAKAACLSDDVMVLADGRAFDNVGMNAPYTVRRFGGLKPLRRRRKSKSVAALCEANSVSHIFCDSWKSAEHLPADLPASVVVYAHGNEYPSGDIRPSKKHVRIQQSLSKADHVIAVSHKTRDRLLPYLPDGQAPAVHIYPNPVDAPVQPSTDDQSVIQTHWDRLGTTPDDVRLLCLARLTAWKGIDRAVTAVADLRAGGTTAKLLIAGAGEDLPRLQALVAQLELNDHVSFIGRIEGGLKSALYRSADIYLQPGRTENGQCEGYGITYIEAGLHGLPSLSGRDGGAPDAVQDGRTGLIVDGTDQAQINTALTRLIDETALRTQMGREARQHAQSLLWDKQIGRVLALTKGT